MLLVDKKDFTLRSSGRLVKAEEVAAAQSAAEALAAAEAEAAEAEAARIREEAKAAFEEEKRRGYEEGLEQGRMEIAEKKLEMLDSSVAYMESVEGRMADIVMKALHKCVEEIGDKELVVQVVRKVMSAVIRTQKQVTLKVAQGMGPVVKERLSQILADYPTVEHIDVVEDERLKGPACMIETEAGVADGSVDSQLAAIERSIKKHFSKAE